MKPFILVYDIKRNADYIPDVETDIVELMKNAEYGRKQERIQIAKAINKSIFKERRDNLVCFADRFDYNGNVSIHSEDMWNYFSIYAKILANIGVCTVCLFTEKYDRGLLVIENNAWELEEPDESTHEYIKRLRENSEIL